MRLIFNCNVSNISLAARDVIVMRYGEFLLQWRLAVAKDRILKKANNLTRRV